MKQLTRREFVKAAAVVTGAAAGILSTGNALALEYFKVEDPMGRYAYRGWETLYKGQMDYDKFARSTHSANCTGSCTWKVFVKNGIMFKEEQYADYPDISADLPTYNPRGCQKGANYIEYVYGPQRLKYPLIRKKGTKRGEGKWIRATWDEALNYIATGEYPDGEKVTEGIVDIIKDSDLGPGYVSFYSAIPAKHHLTLAGGYRLANLLGGVVHSFYDWYADLPPGEPITWGVQTDSCESADWFNSKYILISGANLLETRIPDSHFFTEARAKGTKIVCISPEYNATSTHADIYVPIKPGTEAAFFLGLANVIVNEGLHNVEYLKQFTDFPILVRKDNGKFLRLSDDPASPDFNKYYLWDTVGNKAVIAPGSLGFKPAVIPEDGSDAPPWTLGLGNVKPALEGDFVVNKIPVTTVFSLLKKKLADYAPSAVSGITGIDTGLITSIAREFATAKPARVIEGAGTNHYYHNDLINRAQILLVALTGNVGKPGGGFDHYVGQEKLWAEHGFFQLSYPHGRPKQRFQPTTLWTFVNSDVDSDVDSVLPKSLKDYIEDSVNNKWMPLYPEGALDGKRPKAMIIWGANYLNQAKGFEDVLDNLWPELDLIVDINFHMDTTALYADVCLPAASWYEKWDINTTDLHSYIHPFTPVLDPLHESKTDWQIWQALAAKLQEKFIKAGFTKLNDTVYFTGQKVTRSYDTLVSDFENKSVDRNVANDKDASQFLLDNSPETKGLTNSKIDEHPRRFLKTGAEWTSDIIDGKAYYGFQRMTEKKRPLTTQTGRQQFYIDHDWFLELKEQLPVYKPPLEADDPSKYPLRWITPHGRWSIHSTWRNAKFQLRLQRGRPVVYLSPGEASKRGLQDDDLVEVSNDHGEFQARLYISPRLPNGMALMYHGWEKYFMNNNFQAPTIIRIKPTQLVGKYGQLNFSLNYWGPTGNQKDTRVQIKKAEQGG